VLVRQPIVLGWKVGFATVGSTFSSVSVVESSSVAPSVSVTVSTAS
jgi:hypothetical protein